MDDESKLFYRELLDFGPGVGYRESKEKFMREKRDFDAKEELRMDNIATNPNKKFLDTFIEKKMAGVPYTVNPPVSFITGGTGKVIKFHHPLDLRTVEEKMQRYPFVGYRS